MFTEDEVAFVSQSTEFLGRAREEYPRSVGSTIADVLARPPRALVPTLLDETILAPSQLEDLARAFDTSGLAYFMRRPSGQTSGRGHAILDIARQLAAYIPCEFAIDHPMEKHPEALARFGPPDGTLKLYDLPIPVGVDKYREQAETNRMFDSHNDGLGYGGKVATIAMSLDSPPLWGGFTYFVNLVEVSLALANDDRKAFDALFLPDALTAIRPRGKGAIKVSTPILYVNDEGNPQTFYRRSTGEYRISSRRECEDLDRALAVLARCTEPFGPSSCVVHFTRPGEGVFVNNEHVVHGRTDFLNDDGVERVLARKWFTRKAIDTSYKHVPGMNIASSYGDLFPDRFGGAVQEGEWHYDSGKNANVRIG